MLTTTLIAFYLQNCPRTWFEVDPLALRALMIEQGYETRSP